MDDALLKLYADQKNWPLFEKEKDRLFAERKATGTFPAALCQKGRCQVGGCCGYVHHHRGDCCVHCGNDER